MKTPEELGKLSQQFIEDYFGPEGGGFDEEVVAETSFLAGYKAAAPQWVSAKNRLPEDEEIAVLVLISGDGWHDHDVAYYYSAKWYDEYDDIVEGVTHWQELPEPPKEEK